MHGVYRWVVVSSLSCVLNFRQIPHRLLDVGLKPILVLITSPQILHRTHHAELREHFRAEHRDHRIAALHIALVIMTRVLDIVAAHLSQSFTRDP